jgi:hypothetical protein
MIVIFRNNYLGILNYFIYLGKKDIEIKSYHSI